MLEEARHIEEKEFISKVEPIYKSVFEYDGTTYIDCGRIFSKSIECRTIVYRCAHFPDHPIMDAVIKAAARLGDKGIYMSGTCLEPEKLREMGKYRHWHLSFRAILEIQQNANHPAYETAFTLGSNQFYSPQGVWGLRTFEDYFAVLGGSDNFIAEVFRFMPTLNLQVFDFLEYFRDWNVTGFWLFDLLAHVYDVERARQLMHEYAFPIDNIREVRHS